MQELSEQGFFKKYLYKFCRTEKEGCSSFTEIDDAENAVFICRKWVNEREEAISKNKRKRI